MDPLDSAAAPAQQAQTTPAPAAPAPEAQPAAAPTLATQAAATPAAPAATTEAPKAPAAEVPPSADQYDFTIPADIGLKNEKGDAFQFDKADPFVVEARKIFADGKVSKDAAAQVVGLYARAMKASAEVAAQQQKAAAEQAINAELAKLATKSSDNKDISGAQRVQSVLAGVDAVLGAGASTELAAGLTTAAAVIRIEQLIAKAQAGAGGKPPAGATDKFAGLTGSKLLAALHEQKS